MILMPNDKVHVDAYEAGIARVSGQTWVRDGVRGDYLRKGDERTKIVAIASGTVLVYQLPESVDLDNATFTNGANGVFLEDGDGFRMNMSESSRSNIGDAA